MFYCCSLQISKMKLFVIFLLVTASVCFPNKNLNLSNAEVCTSCNADNNSGIHSPNKITSNDTVKRNLTEVHERNLLRLRSNCNSGERMDKAGRCRESFR